MAAQVASVLILAEAGVLSERKYVFPSQESAENHSSLESAKYGSGMASSRIERIVTSGICPLPRRENRELKDGTPELTKAFIAELSSEK